MPLNPTGRQEYENNGARIGAPFFTADVVKHFMAINNNYYRNFQNEYEQFRSEPQLISEQMNLAKQNAFLARK